MTNQMSIAGGHSSAARRPKQASAYSKEPAPRPQINVQSGQDVLLIWLDNNINFNSADSLNTIIQLQHTVPTLSTFTDGDECIRFLERMDNDKAWLIISGSLGKHIVPRIHGMFQVDSVFIFCDNNKRHEQWTKEWPKIKGVFTEIVSICEALKQAVQRYEQNAIPISFMDTSDDISKKNLDQLDPSFMYTQILKEIFLTISFEQKHITDFSDHCRALWADNEYQQRKIENFAREYYDKTPIWWYSGDTYLFEMVNRALRLMNVDVIIKMGFFISDLHRHIEQLHDEQFNGCQSGNSFILYRGQALSKTDFDQLTKTKGGLMSFNNFLSTSADRNVALAFTGYDQYIPDKLWILFVMTIDPSKSLAPFASIDRVSFYDIEEEFLFSMHTVFRISEIKSIGENHCFFEVDLTPTSDDDRDLRALTDCIREENFSQEKGWHRLGRILLTMGYSQKAQQIYEILLEQTINDSEKARIYNQLGHAKDDQGKYKEAITFYEKSLEISEKTLPPKHSDLAASYNNIGLVYCNMGEYSKALWYYEKELEIDQQTLSSNHPDLASSYNNIGNVCRNMGEYSTALSYYEKALEIKQQSPPSNHPDLAVSYNNIGTVYYTMGDYTKAHLSYEKALKIRENTLPPKHPDLAASYNNIGNVYDEMNEYSKALLSYEKALEIQQQSLPSNHPDLAASCNNIGCVYEKIDNYSKACSSYERAVDIGQHSLPSSHPHLETYRNNLDIVKKKL